MNKLIYLFIFIFLISSVSGQPAFITNDLATGLDIDPLVYGNLKQSQDFTLHLHVYNNTNGLLVTNATTNCSVHLYNSSGNHILTSMNIDWDNKAEWELVINGNNFSKVGVYSMEVWCYGRLGSGVGGANRLYFDVTSAGKDTNTPNAIIYGIMFAILIGLFVLSSYIFIETPFNNPKNEYGELTGVDWKKYIKIGALTTSYIVALALSYFAWAISFGILEFTEMSNIFLVIFKVLSIGLYLVVPVTVTLTLIVLFKDWNIYQDVQRGFNRK